MVNDKRKNYKDAGNAGERQETESTLRKKLKQKEITIRRPGKQEKSDKTELTSRI